VFSYHKRLTFLLILKQIASLTVFKKPSRISVTCSGLKDPTNRINGFDVSDTYPPQSNLYMSNHIKIFQAYTVPFLLRSVFKASASRLGNTANEMTINSIITTLLPSV
jgi:hypothetical protein